MKDIQSRIMDRVEAIAKGRERDASVKHDYSNTGLIVFYAPDSMDPEGSLHFSFQKNYVTFKIGTEHLALLDYDRTDFDNKLAEVVLRALQ